MGAELFLGLVSAGVVCAILGGVIGFFTGCLRSISPANHDVGAVNLMFNDAFHGLVAGGCLGLFVGFVGVIYVMIQISKHALYLTAKQVSVPTDGVVNKLEFSGWNETPLPPASIKVGIAHPGGVSHFPDDQEYESRNPSACNR